MSIFLGFILLLFEVTSSPALEKRHSDGTEVPGIDKYFCANTLSKVYIVFIMFLDHDPTISKGFGVFPIHFPPHNAFLGELHLQLPCCFEIP